MERLSDSSEQDIEQIKGWGELAAGPQLEQYGEVDAMQKDETEPVQKISRDEWLSRERNDPKRAEYITRNAEDIADIELGFKKRIAKLRTEGDVMSQKEFEKWEDGYIDDWNYIERDLENLDYNTQSQEALEYQAKVESPMFSGESNLDDSVEAYSGEFFDERSKMLRDAITASDSKTKDSDLRILGTFWSSVAEHLDYKYMTPSEVRDTFGDSTWDYKNYDRRRTDAHNAAITHLNHLNALAKTYGTRPFTPRDLWTSQNQQQTPAMSRRMSYDRHVFESFYTHAFGDRVAQVQRKHERNNF